MAPEIVFSDQELSPAPPEDGDVKTFDFLDEVMQANKIRYVASDGDDGSAKKPDSEFGLRPGLNDFRTFAASVIVSCPRSI